MFTHFLELTKLVLPLLSVATKFRGNKGLSSGIGHLWKSGSELAARRHILIHYKIVTLELIQHRKSSKQKRA